MKDDVSKAQARQIMDLIFDRSVRLSQAGRDTEVLTVDNHADGVYLYLRLKKEDPKKAEEVLNLLKIELLRNLRNHRPLLKGKCACCRYQDICAGNFCVRAEAVYGDVWQEDPACYLTEEEIA